MSATVQRAVREGGDGPYILAFNRRWRPNAGALLHISAGDTVRCKVSAHDGGTLEILMLNERDQLCVVGYATPLRT